MAPGQKGSALVISILVLVILTVLGVSFLLLAETENRIAENERLSSQALYFAEAGTHVVIQWFDHPGSTSNVILPPQAAANRTRRKIDEDGDPATPPHDQDGAAWPRYKQEVDQDRNGEDDLFDKPYRFDLRNTFLGTEDGPDVRIDAGAPGPGRDFLDDLSEALAGGYPAAEGGIRARISRIDVYAPPYLRIGGRWTRHGIATVKVIGRIYRVS
ncbi:MAG: pilus assembly PilX N-terminal domain-containing protein, partial [Thermoplasmata archaeon]